MQLNQSVFSVWTVAQPVVVEMEMHRVVNLATLQTPLATFFPFKKAAEPYLVWELPVLPREVLHFQCVHTFSLVSIQRVAEKSSALIQLNTDIMLLL